MCIVDAGGHSCAQRDSPSAVAVGSRASGEAGSCASGRVSGGGGTDGSWNKPATVTCEIRTPRWEILCAIARYESPCWRRARQRPSIFGVILLGLLGPDLEGTKAAAPPLRALARKRLNVTG